MQLKNYQRRVLDEFAAWLARSSEEVPIACIKVPTGGGKTFIATCAVKKIFEARPQPRRVVVWLVPSEAILSQTLAALRNNSHPYRQRLNLDFRNRVAIFDKDQCLNGQNFNLANVGGQLSILVLSYDSFRGRKEILRSRQANGNLSSFDALPLERPIEDADESSLIQSINKLNPAIIVDESHHAKSALSLEMLRNFNPSLVLELTATPRASSKVISIVSAAELKREDMVKLPVIVRNLNGRNEVLAHAIEMRRRLELAAQSSARYIRPIVLLQAQPKTDDDSETFGRLREELIRLKIPAEQIAIKTAEINELRGVELMSRECPIRFIITVDALREGWDCPFAYILASVANKSSAVDVEQIVGRILRLPHSMRNAEPNLNESYVLTSSAKFNETLKKIVVGLNAAGFGENECRGFDERKNVEQPELFSSDNPIDLDGRNDPNDRKQNDPIESDEEFMRRAASIGVNYESSLELQSTGGFGVKSYRVKPEFAADVEAIRLPQFVIESKSGEWVGAEQTMFDDSILLEKETLEIDFDLSGAESTPNFIGLDEEIFALDVEGDRVRSRKLREDEQLRIVELGMTDAAKLRRGRQAIVERLRTLNSLSDETIRLYVDRLIETRTPVELERLKDFPSAFAELAKKFVDDILLEHRRKKFVELLDAGRIKCEPRYRMPRAITPSNSIDHIARSLYEAEDSMNTLETRLVIELTKFDAVKWWHRNIAQREFCINGFINHYPDVMIMLRDGRIVFAETKGEHLRNDESKQRARLGNIWQARASERFEYFMVFEDKDAPTEGVVSMNRFLNWIGGQ